MAATQHDCPSENSPMISPLMCQWNAVQKMWGNNKQRTNNWYYCKSPQKIWRTYDSATQTFTTSYFGSTVLICGWQGTKCMNSHGMGRLVHCNLTCMLDLIMRKQSGQIYQMPCALINRAECFHLRSAGAREHRSPKPQDLLLAWCRPLGSYWQSWGALCHHGTLFWHPRSSCSIYE